MISCTGVRRKKETEFGDLKDPVKMAQSQNHVIVSLQVMKYMRTK